MKCERREDIIGKYAIIRRFGKPVLWGKISNIQFFDRTFKYFSCQFEHYEMMNGYPEEIVFLNDWLSVNKEDISDDMSYTRVMAMVG